MAGCVGCGKGLAYSAPDNLCTTCLSARDLYEGGTIPSTKPQLKLFRLNIAAPGNDELEVMALGTDVRTVQATVLESVRVQLKWENVTCLGAYEVPGPFKHGSILSYKVK